MKGVYCVCGVPECDGRECLTPEGDARCRELARRDDAERMEYEGRDA